MALPGECTDIDHAVKDGESFGPGSFCRFFGHRSRDYTFDKSSSDDDQSHNRDNAVLQATR